MPNPARLSGQVRSSEKGIMDGVLVSAHRNGSNIILTVLSNAEGHYAHADHSCRGYERAGRATTDIRQRRPI